MFYDSISSIEMHDTIHSFIFMLVYYCDYDDQLVSDVVVVECD